MQLLSGTLAMATAADAAGVAWWAHVGGFVAGMSLVTLLRRRDRSVRVWRDQYAPW
jgi:membrane associated rhomboid family serine protease